MPICIVVTRTTNGHCLHTESEKSIPLEDLKTYIWGVGGEA